MAALYVVRIVGINILEFGAVVAKELAALTLLARVVSNAVLSGLGSRR